MHLYTHERMWPQMADLAALLGSECNLTDAGSGGDCFDESTSMPWMKLADHFHKYPIPLACQAVTVELRGQYDVSHHNRTLFWWAVARGRLS
jgi:predicted deacylase